MKSAASEPDFPILYLKRYSIGLSQLSILFCLVIGLCVCNTRLN